MQSFEFSHCGVHGGMHPTVSVVHGHSQPLSLCYTGATVLQRDVISPALFSPALSPAYTRVSLVAGAELPIRSTDQIYQSDLPVRSTSQIYQSDLVCAVVLSGPSGCPPCKLFLPTRQCLSPVAPPANPHDPAPPHQHHRTCTCRHCRVRPVALIVHVDHAAACCRHLCCREAALTGVRLSVCAARAGLFRSRHRMGPCNGVGATCQSVLKFIARQRVPAMHPQRIASAVCS